METSPEQVSLAQELLRESKQKMGKAALNYALDECYDGSRKSFHDYLTDDEKNHWLLPHYYIILLDREDITSFFAYLSKLLRDILFRYIDTVSCLSDIKNRLLTVAPIIDRLDSVKGIVEILNIYEHIRTILAEGETFTPEKEGKIKEITSINQYTKHWLIDFQCQLH